MSQDTKIRLSAHQLQALRDTGFFDVKREVTQLISLLFHELQEELVKEWQALPWSEIYPSPPPKIFKGENYKGYPYVNLDFPRLFRSDRVFAFRTLFWWGHPFSFTLHLQGDIYHEVKERVFSLAPSLSGKGYYLCANGSPWEYHFEKENYRLLDEVLRGEGIAPAQQDKDFIKLSRRLELQSYTDLTDVGTEIFRDLAGLLGVRNR